MEDRHNLGLDQTNTVQTDGYGIAAKYYDLLYQQERFNHDIPFYLELAKSINGPILELGAGTGRVTLELARDGHQVVAVDLSEAMLSVLSNKLSREPREVRDRITMINASMVDVKLDRQFEMIISPFRAFMHLISVEEQRQCLRGICSALTPDGIYVHNVFNPNLKYIVNAIEQSALWQTDLEAVDEQNQVIRRSHELKPDAANQVHNIRWKYEVFDRFGKLIETQMETMQLRWQYRFEAIFLLELCGLKIQNAYGGYDKVPLDEQASELIYVCQRNDQRRPGSAS